MNDWFEWNGIRSSEYGIVVTELPPPTVPAERVNFTNIPGKSGSLTTLEGDYVYDDLILTATCVISDPTRIPEIAGWLQGSGKVTFANREGGFYFARVTNQIPFEKILRGNPHRMFAVTFRCKPFWYKANLPITNITGRLGTASGSSSITNPGNVPSEPIITLTGNGDITLIIGLTIVELSGISGSITLDSTLQEAYHGVESMNSCMSGDFPILLPGKNSITWTGSVTNIAITPNWRYL